MTNCGILAACLSLCIATPAMACDEPLAGAIAAQAPTAEIEQLSQRFATLYMPMDSSIANSARIGAQEFRRGVEMNEGGAELIAAEPERYRFVEQAAVTALRQCLERRLPDIHIMLANLAMARFSASDLRRINAFYESDGVQAWMRAVGSSMRAPDDLIDTEGNARTVTATDIERVVNETPLTSLTRQQQVAIAMFSRTPTGVRLEAESQQLVQIIASGINGINAQSVPTMERAVIEAMAEWAAREGQPASEGSVPK